MSVSFRQQQPTITPTIPVSLARDGNTGRARSSIDGTRQRAAAISATSVSAIDRVVDIGCGPGSAAQATARRGAQ